MCEFISWKEYKDEILFLTDDDLDTEKGKELVAYLGCAYWDDIPGHGAINYYFNLTPDNGLEKEITDFTDISQFPPQIVEAIKACKFKRIGLSLSLLTKPALADYEKIEQAAWVDYMKINQAAWADYEKINQAAFWKLFSNPKNRIECWR